MDRKLLGAALIKVFSGLLIMALLIFVPAGSPEYWQGWLQLGILFIPMIVAGFVMFFKCPDLLRKRLNMKEEQKDQTQNLTGFGSESKHVENDSVCKLGG